MSKTLLTVSDAARALAVSPKQIRRWITSKELPEIRLGRLVRIHPEDLENFVARRRVARPLVSPEVLEKG